MHVMLSWDISATGEQWTATNNRLKECLNGYSWVRPLKTVYIVKVSSTDQRRALKEALIAAIKGSGQKVHYVMTPAMEGGSYTGWLPSDLWTKIDQRTKQ